MIHKNIICNILNSFICILVFMLMTGCSLPIEIERGQDPWVRRINLDDHPRMITLSLHPALYAAYDPTIGALYKVWKGDIKLSGPVFDNIHRSQPITRGEAYIDEDINESPWMIRTSDGSRKVIPDFKGYSLKDQKVTLNYILELSEGEVIRIEETPEYITGEGGKPGYERIIVTSDIPRGSELLLNVSYKHLSSESGLEVNGELVDESFQTNEYDWGSSISGSGVIVLKTNDKTIIQSYFEPKATNHIEINAPKQQEDVQEISEEVTGAVGETRDMSVLIDEGKVLIGTSDCAACHKMNETLIGPSYNMIAQKYETSMQVVEQLSNKIVNGSTGVWGARVMSAHPNISKTDAKSIAAYILSTIPDNEGNLKPGVAVNYYQIGQPLPSLPQVIAGQEPNVSVVYPNIDFRSGNPDIGEATDENFNDFKTDFVMQVSGYLNVEESKTYDLQFIANNGGRLKIDEKIILEGQYYEGTYTGEKELYLNKGSHKVDIDFYHHLFDKYLILGWRDKKTDEYEPVPYSAFTHNPFDIKPASSGNKEILKNSAPGFGASLVKVHPAFDLSAVRPSGFNPRVGDISFMDDNRLVLCTWDGEVFIIDNVTNPDTSKIEIIKIAEGLCEPLGISVVEGDIYVLQRWELTKLIDLDGDKIIDEYYSLSDQWGTSPDFHEWSFGLIYRDGYFYATLGIAQGRFYDEMPPDRGRVLKISIKDGSHSFVAQGLKEPNGIGFGTDGEIFVADNEGEYVPVSKIVHIPKNAYPFFGVRSSMKTSQPKLKEKPPVLWLPQNEIGNSPSQPVVINSGPYKGQMLHGEITHGGIKRDFVEKVKGEYQGAVFRFAQGLEVGINRLEWGPDGALYAAGLGSAQDYGHQGHLFGLERLTYNGNIPFEMLAIRAKANGIEIEFTKPLRIADGTDPADYMIQQWYYQTGHESNFLKQDLETLSVISTSISPDRKKVFLEINGMKKEHVIYVQLQPPFLSENNEQLWSNEGWYTLNAFPDHVGDVHSGTRGSKSNSLSSEEIKNGWKLLFDGNSTKNWNQVNNKNAWSIREGNIVGSGDSSLLASNKSYENFELEMEWKIENAGEGAIFYNIGEAVHLKIPRFQIVDDRSNPDGKEPLDHKTGALYKIKAPDYFVTKPANEYNHSRLVVNNGEVEHWVNGIRVLMYHIKDIDAFNKNIEGLIGLYSVKGKIYFRNIRLREHQSN